MALQSPKAPNILARILEAQQDLQATGVVIETDSDLCKELLATINAPYFSLVREIKTATEATLLLGSQRVINLATARLLRRTFFASSKPSLQEIWKTSLRVAIIGVLVSKALSKASPDEVYTSCLFFNVGMSLLYSQHEHYLKEIKIAYQDEVQSISLSEVSAFGQSHADLSAQIAEAWGLNKTITQAIALHHSPDALKAAIAKDDDLGELLLVIKVAEHIAKLPGYLVKAEVDVEWNLVGPTILDELVLTEGMFKRFEHTIKTKLSQIKG